MIAYTIVECNIKVKILYILHKISCWMKPQKNWNSVSIRKNGKNTEKRSCLCKNDNFLFIY